jgi:hypothetical protein
MGDMSRCLLVLLPLLRFTLLQATSEAFHVPFVLFLSSPHPYAQPQQQLTALDMNT